MSPLQDCSTSKRNRSSSDMFAFLNKRAEERRTAQEAEMKIREKELEARKGDSDALSSGILQMMTVLQQQQIFQRDKDERDRREREEERRLQREQDSQVQLQLTSVLWALVKKLEK